MALLLAISAALTLAGSHAFAKSGGGPAQVKTSGTSAAPSGSTSSGGPRTGGNCHGHACPTRPQQGNTQPPCRGGHAGPNGVMVQCQ